MNILRLFDGQFEAREKRLGRVKGEAGSAKPRIPVATDGGIAPAILGYPHLFQQGSGACRDDRLDDDGKIGDGLIEGSEHGLHPGGIGLAERPGRSEEHTSELRSLMRISYAVIC